MSITNSMEGHKISMKQPNNEVALNYKIETKQLVTFMEETTEDLIVTEVSKEFIKKDNIGNLYKVNIHKRTQNNLEGSRELGAYLEKLNEKVFVYTNAIGQITSIPNFGGINETWTDIRYEFKEKFKKTNKDINEMLDRMDLIMSNQKSFLALYRQTEVATLLFPPIFIDDLSSPDHKIFQYKIFPFFFGQHSLPIKVLTSLVSNNDSKNLSVLRTGFIDNTLFNKKEVQSMFRELYKSPTLVTDAECDYSEMFYLNKKNDINTANQILNTSIGEVYRFNQFTNASLL